MLMRFEYLDDTSGRKKFLKFKNRLYYNDLHYIDTESFFLRNCLSGKNSIYENSQPFFITEDNNVLLEGVFIFNPKFNCLQIGFFQAVENRKDAVDFMIDESVKLAKKHHLKQVLIGMNGHISCPNGILIDGFDEFIPYGSLYNKPYYKDYFKELKSYNLSTFASKSYDIRQRIKGLKIDNKDIRVKKADFSRFDDEFEKMRIVAEKVSTKNPLHFMTSHYHYLEMVKPIKHLLREENLLFAETKGVTIGFLLWHPNFNEIARKGKKLNKTMFNFKCLTKLKTVNSLKISSMCTVNSPRATIALLAKLKEIENGRYEYVETTAVQEENINTMLLNEKLFIKPNRKYAIYYIDV